MSYYWRGFVLEAIGAERDGVVVDSGSGAAPDPISTYFGFTGDTFNQILISQPDGEGPYWLIGDLTADAQR